MNAHIRDPLYDDSDERHGEYSSPSTDRKFLFWCGLIAIMEILGCWGIWHYVVKGRL